MISSPPDSFSFRATLLALILCLPALLCGQEKTGEELGGASESVATSVIGSPNLPPGISVAPSPPVDEHAEEKKALRLAILSVVPPERHFRELLADVLLKVYSERLFRPLWDAASLPPGIHRPLSTELASHAFPDLMALDPDAISPSLADAPVEARDLAYTIALIDAGMLVRLGAVPGDRIWPEWNKDDTPGEDGTSVDAIAGDLVAATAIRPFDVSRIVRELGPENWIYRELHRAFPAAKEAILSYSGLPQIPDPSAAGSVKPGDFFAYAPAIAAHLIDRGYLQMDQASAATLTQMTPELTAGLIAFQRDYGLDPDGVFGPASWRYLNENAADQYRSITINLHRARLLPDKLGERYVVANLPTAELYLFDQNDFFAGSMRIVHGKADKESHHTPVFRDVMQEIVFGPYWNVPPGIASKELVPKALEDWGYLSRNGYEIVSDFNPYNKNVHPVSVDTLEMVRQGRLFLRQRPGPENALGHVKFLFPNKYSVYMHDTPAKNFFFRSNRDFSHGCIRVAEPEKLGAWVLRPENWTEPQVKAAIDAEERRSMVVKGGIPVYIIYLTTFPRPIPGGKIVLAPGRDVYEKDMVDAAVLSSVIPWQQTETTRVPLRATVVSP